MGYNEQTAIHIARQTSGRDRARFFEGRTEEIQAFRDSLVAAQDRTQSIFRFYQGAPGSGKTSLADHLAHGDHPAVFIKVSDYDLEDREALLMRVREGAREQGGDRAALAVRWAGLCLDKLAGGAADAIAKRADEMFLGHLSVALHIDEAHSLEEPALRTLRSLHVNGLGGAVQSVPSVVLLTGLQHTRQHICQFPGMTRAGDDTTMTMRKLSPEECAQSTRRMLAEVVPGTPADDLAELTASASLGWPRHLFAAQKATCEEIIRVGGDAALACKERIQKRTTEHRSTYYSRRMSEIAGFDDNRLAFLDTLKALAKGNLEASIPVLAELLAESVSRHAPMRAHMDTTPMAQSLESRGVAQRTNWTWELAIPSMGDWASEQMEIARQQQRRGIGR